MLKQLLMYVYMTAKTLLPNIWNGFCQHTSIYDYFYILFLHLDSVCHVRMVTTVCDGDSRHGSKGQMYETPGPRVSSML